MHTPDHPILYQTFQRLREKQPELRKESIQKRKDRLAKLRRWIHQNRTRIHDAAFADFRKPSAEVDGVEIFHVLNEIHAALKNIDKWTKPKKVDAPLTMFGTRSWIHYEPRGTCLIISPWNYPFSLAVGPLVSAIAAGNNVMLKPSELTPHMSALLLSMTDEIFENDIVCTCEGDSATAQYLLSLPFDHVFFTGSPAIGKIVMQAAAQHLTSVTLELGGKSPTIVTASANIHEAATRIAVAKFVNNGQTCLAPDYLLVEESIQHPFIAALIEQTKKRFTHTDQSFEASDSYCRIVNEKHFTRLTELLQEALQQGAKLEFGGEADQGSRYLHPVILSNVPLHARLMQEEIFGPILPVIPYKNLDEAIAFINQKPKALGLYVFGTNSRDIKRVLSETSSGGVCINECAIHFLHHNLPFGGINNSGLGKSHGYYGFLAFSNEKPVMKQKHGFTSIQPFYPPYTRRSQKLMDWFLKLF